MPRRLTVESEWPNKAEKGQMMTTPHCVAIRKSGIRCPNPPLRGRQWCFTHDPEQADARKQGSYKGGKGKSNAARARKAIPEDLRDVGDLLLQAITDVKNEDLDVGKAAAMATLTRAYVAVYEAGLVDAKLKELEARLDGQADPGSGRKTA